MNFGHQLKKRIPTDQLVAGILDSNRILLSKAITLVESRLPEDQVQAVALLDQIIPHSGKALRIGLTGVPGVGKSTFIESFGNLLIKKGKRVAVLSIDPSSSLTRGSILGDKTRMATLSTNPMAFIRPSPAGNSLGGVASKTRETILLCEAAGFDLILVETVGVGQSETMVKNMVDFFLLLMLAGGGDELQGIKRGIMEMADAILINKADGENLNPAKQAKKAFENALHLFPPHESGWEVTVEVCSAIEKSGLNEIWETIASFQNQMNSNGFLDKQRNMQNIKWMNQLVKDRLESDFFSKQVNKDRLEILQNQILAGNISVRHAVNQLFS